MPQGVTEHCIGLPRPISQGTNGFKMAAKYKMAATA